MGSSVLPPQCGRLATLHGRGCNSALETCSNSVSIAQRLQQLADPLPAARLRIHGPDQMSTRRIGQLGDYPDQLAVKITGLLLAVIRSMRDEGHYRALPPNQACRDVAVIVESYLADIPCPDDVGPIVVGHPHI